MKHTPPSVVCGTSVSAFQVICVNFHSLLVSTACSSIVWVVYVCARMCMCMYAVVETMVCRWSISVHFLEWLHDSTWAVVVWTNDQSKSIVLQ